MKQKDLAQLCSCTPATVSKVFHNARGVSPELRARILAAAKEHGITIEKERLTAGHTVLVLTPEYYSEMYTAKIACLNHILWERGMESITMCWEFDQNHFIGLMHTIRLIHRLCGIIVMATVDDICLSALQSLKLPFVIYSRQENADSIHGNFFVTLCTAIQHLLDSGRRRIAFTGEQLTIKREQYFRQAMAKLGLPVDERLIYRSDLRYVQAGADGFAALFGRDEPPDAIICGYDYIAFGILNAAEAAGIAVPRELAVIGIDNIRATGIYRLGLTTIGMNCQLLCETLLELLLWRIREPDAPKRHIDLSYELIIRETG
ncbi:MAG: LacI family DNA-binding transcriptional regulator [Clostridia bacterium]|nr:LacI family DNA-binding transcriptional regulator [Clostridia bacterium]